MTVSGDKGPKTSLGNRALLLWGDSADVPLRDGAVACPFHGLCRPANARC